MNYLFLILFLFIPAFVYSSDSYTYIEDLIDQNKIPRILNIQDFPELSKNNIDPFVVPMGDFDMNGSTDSVISGIFDLLGSGRNKYFLLVASTNKKNRSEKIFYEESDLPYFLYLPGTTGQGDPRNQSFSISHCYNCESGLDFFWNKKNKTFSKKKWDRPQIQQAKITPKVESDINPEEIDKAIKLVSLLSDVQVYTDRLKNEGKKIGVAVSLIDEKKFWYEVNIFERKNYGEKEVYDVLTVDLKKNKILRRNLKGLLKGGNKNQ